MNYLSRISESLRVSCGFATVTGSLKLCASMIALALSNSVIAQAAVTPKITFKSTLENYKPYSDEKPGGWKAANDQVGRIGGWRTYLKEANEPESATIEVKPAPRPENPRTGHGSK
jgi:hypothetical protein